MAWHGGEPPLLLRPRASRQLAAFIFVTHLLACAVALALPLGWLRWLLVAVLVAAALQALAQHVWRRSAGAIVMVRWGNDGLWQVTLRCGICRELALSPATFVGQSLIVLVFQDGWARSRSLPLFADALDAGQLRELRRRLRTLSVEHTGAIG